MQEDAVLRQEKKLYQFIEALPNAGRTKEDAFAASTKFLSQYLDVPAVYIAVKKPVGESEALHYFSANPGQEHIIGKKLMKPAEAEGEEVPARQGISFEAFKLPEVGAVINSHPGVKVLIALSLRCRRKSQSS